MMGGKRGVGGGWCAGKELECGEREAIGGGNHTHIPTLKAFGGEKTSKVARGYRM